MQDIARATVATAENETDHIVFSDEEKSAGKLYVCPKPFQRLSIPYALDGTNMIIASETGSGKTLVFLMAIFLNAFPQTQAACADVRPGIRAILIVPTGNRQLVQQHEDTFKRVVNHLRKAGDVFWKTAMLDDNRDIRTGRTLRRGVASSHYRPPAQKGSSRQSAHMHGRASGGGAAGDGGVVAAADENRDDRRDDFSQALIRIDTADRIKLGFRESPRMFQEVQVIAMDEVDKICGSQKDKDVVEELIKSCSHAQILSASATIVRHFEHRPDPATEWLKQDLFLTRLPNGLPRPLISIQTENVMPSSVFHLFLDLRKLRQGDHDRIQLAWEGLHVLKGTSVFPVPCMLFWNVAKSMKDHCQKLENSFADRQATKQKPELVELERNKPVVQKARDLENLRQGRSTGAIGNKCYATGMDYSFRSVTISHYAAEFLSSDYSWDTYTHTSGRCGRKPGELGMCVVFIRNEVCFARCLPLRQNPCHAPF
jgi:superfamily II DNA/RNA helicase